jgi:hypothetical protein
MSTPRVVATDDPGPGSSRAVLGTQSVHVPKDLAWACTYTMDASPSWPIESIDIYVVMSLSIACMPQAVLPREITAWAGPRSGGVHA